MSEELGKESGPSDEEGTSSGLRGLISPRFLAKNPPKRHRHFRREDGRAECSDDGEGEGLSGDLDVEIVDVDDSTSDETTDGASLTSPDAVDNMKKKKSHDSGSKLGRSAHTPRRHRERNYSTESVCVENGPPPLITLDKDRRASVATESESATSRVFHQDSSTNTSNSSDAPKTPVARTESGRPKLQRAARMTPQEIKSVMSTIPSEPSPRALAKAKASSGGLLLHSSRQGMMSPTESDDSRQPLSPLCYPQPDDIPSTPGLASHFLSPPLSATDPPAKMMTGGAGAAPPKNSEKTRRKGHNRFFSMSVLKPVKVNPNAPKDHSSNPSSPLIGQKGSSGGSPDPKVFSMTLDEVLQDPDLSGMFMRYLERMEATEGLEFLMRLETLKKHEKIPGINTYTLHEEALIMYEFFIREGAQKELNLSRCTREYIEAKLIAPKAEQLTDPSILFKEARLEVYNMLGTNLYCQWLASLH